MGREVRMVPPNWKHPSEKEYNYQTGEWIDTEIHRRLHYNYNHDLAKFEARVAEKGLRSALEYFGGGPLENDYMLVDVPDESCTHYMMYEDTTEGTPISPAFETPEELARWLADNNASAFGSSGATYEQWLSTIQRGYAVSAIGASGVGIFSGVEAQHYLDN